MKLEGTTDIFPLRELIEMVTYSTVTGALNIYWGSIAGSIFFRDGRLVHISCGSKTGLDALSEIFFQQAAHFTFVSGTCSEEETVWGDAHFLLNSAEQAAARWHAVRAIVPRLELVPQVFVAREQVQRRRLPAETMLLQAIDGRADLHALSERLAWASIDVCEVVAELMKADLIALNEPQAAGNEPSRGSPAQPRGRAGLFERIVAPTIA